MMSTVCPSFICLLSEVVSISPFILQRHCQSRKGLVNSMNHTEIFSVRRNITNISIYEYKYNGIENVVSVLFSSEINPSYDLN